MKKMSYELVFLIFVCLFGDMQFKINDLFGGFAVMCSYLGITGLHYSTPWFGSSLYGLIYLSNAIHLPF